MQIQAALTEPLEALGLGQVVDADFGGSVGEALFPDDGLDAEALLKKADRRMYSQKFASRAVGRDQPLRRAHEQTRDTPETTV
jgi:GGDEF domain-containing protein